MHRHMQALTHTKLIDDTLGISFVFSQKPIRRECEIEIVRESRKKAKQLENDFCSQRSIWLFSWYNPNSSETRLHIILYAPYEKSNCKNEIQKKKLILSCIVYTYTPRVDRQMKKGQQQKRAHTSTRNVWSTPNGNEKKPFTTILLWLLSVRERKCMCFILIYNYFSLYLSLSPSIQSNLYLALSLIPI